MALRITLAAIAFVAMMASFLRYVLKPIFSVDVGHGRRAPSRAWAVLGILGYVGFVVATLAL